jgi:hypothetical protein
MELIDTVVLPSDSIARLFLSLSEASIVLGALLLFSALTSEKICRQSGPFVRSSEKRAPTPELAWRHRKVSRGRQRRGNLYS